jgi:hypothetical protein
MMRQPAINSEIMKALASFAASVAIPVLYDDEQGGGDQVGNRNEGCQEPALRSGREAP